MNGRYYVVAALAAAIGYGCLGSAPSAYANAAGFGATGPDIPLFVGGTADPVSVANFTINKLSLSGGAQLGYDNEPCDNTLEGTQRYNQNIHNFEYCNGSAWVTLGNTAFPVNHPIIGSADGSTGRFCAAYTDNLGTPYIIYRGGQYTTSSHIVFSQQAAIGHSNGLTYVCMVDTQGLSQLGVVPGEGTSTYFFDKW